MTRTEIMKKIEEIIGHEDLCLDFYRKGKHSGIIQLSKTRGKSKKRLLDKFEIIYSPYDDTYNLWFYNSYGFCFYTFDDCKIRSL